MTTTSTGQTLITIDPDVPLVRITREFDAPPAKVFRAHTAPELVARWLGPRRHEVRPGELIVQTFTYDGMPDGVALEKVMFEDLGGGRTRLTTTSLVDSFQDRDSFVASGME